MKTAHNKTSSPSDRKYGVIALALFCIAALLSVIWLGSLANASQDKASQQVDKIYQDGTGDADIIWSETVDIPAMKNGTLPIAATEPSELEKQRAAQLMCDVAGVCGALAEAENQRLLEARAGLQTRAKMSARALSVMSGRKQALAENSFIAPVAINVPEFATSGKPFDAVLMINSIMDEGALLPYGEREAVLLDDMDNDVSFLGRTRATPTIEVRLSGSKFDVQNQGYDRQALSPDESTSWRWTITALEDGVNSLNFVIYTISGEGDPLLLKTFEKEILVSVEGQSFSEKVKAWSQAFGALILVLFSGAGLAMTTYVKRSVVRMRTKRNETLGEPAPPLKE